MSPMSPTSLPSLPSLMDDDRQIPPLLGCYQDEPRHQPQPAKVENPISISEERTFSNEEGGRGGGEDNNNNRDYLVMNEGLSTGPLSTGLLSTGLT